MKRFLFFLGVLLLFATEILRVYFIMPFPGSQHANTISLAYFIDTNRIWLRIAGFSLVGYALFIHPAPRNRHYTRPRKTTVWPAIGYSLLIVLYGVIFYFFNFRFEADKMFYQPKQIAFASAADNKIPADRLVIGVVLNDQAKAYPIQLIGYHHQVRDTLGQTPIMVTYCTVCRTGRVYSPIVHGKPEQFRLVGMDHFNAMFEDATTKSWWQQATGASIAGPLAGAHLTEIPSAQYTLAQWLHAHPNSAILQPDPSYADQYADLADYDNGTIKGGLEKRDSGSWKAKSWIVGVKAGNRAKAYDWNTLVSHPLIQDSIDSLPILLVLGPDSTDFHAWNRNVNGQILQWTKAPGDSLLKDTNTGSLWNFNGLCVSGNLKNQRLQPLQSYQEFWHSWSQFHPNTTQYKL